MNVNNDTDVQRSKKREALSKALPLPPYEPDLRYQTKDFTRSGKSGLMARPNHLGDGIVVRSLEKRLK